MDVKNKATRIDLFSLKTPNMRAFHMTWVSFFLCFFAWFGIAPLMAVVRDELGLTKSQIGNTIIASVAITILARFAVGWFLDQVGPRLAFSALLVLGSLPVMGIGLAHSYESFLLFRLGIGVIGASFVITQYHTSVMFAPNCVGAANATSAGWGNLGGGVTQMVMPLVFAGFVALGFSAGASWRLSMVAAGAVCLVAGIAYFFLTQDLPDGNFKELRARGEIGTQEAARGSFKAAAKDPRVWALFLIYASCFGIELTINNIAALYFIDNFGLGLKTAGLVAGLFGLMNIFARTTGGMIGDSFGMRWGLNGRVRWIFLALFVEGLALILFSRMTVLPMAIGALIFFSLFTQMSEGATYSVVPFINRKALGSVAGIVGAGGNAGAVAAGFLFRLDSLPWPRALMILGCIVVAASFSAFLVRFNTAEETHAAGEHKLAADHDASLRKGPVLVPAGIFANLTPMVLLRVYLGVALAIKGIYFITDMGGLESQVSSAFGPTQTLVAWFVVLAHSVGGASLAIGLATRWVAGINVIVLAGAVAVHWAGAAGGAGGMALLGDSLNFQFAMLVLITLVVFIWHGSGGFSLDRMIQPGSQDPPSRSEA